MQQREVWALPISLFTDELLPFCYIKILSFTHFESVKLGTKLESCKFKHLINPNYLLKLELVKTRKNWIVKQVLEYKKVCSPELYNDFLKQTHLIKLIQANVTEDEEVSILPFVLESLSSISTFNEAQFELDIKKLLGY
jgi:hypothetical protein